ncbi:MAG: hypothetical protein DRH04_05320 [Deltaproteobacteria bacterium]|nr:MAG: hypothetical protein DRH04_05320 [Deltaproteobacteria bacterium]
MSSFFWVLKGIGSLASNRHKLIIAKLSTKNLESQLNEAKKLLFYHHVSIFQLVALMMYATFFDTKTSISQYLKG